jgi:hypothetical protein
MKTPLQAIAATSRILDYLREFGLPDNQRADIAEIIAREMGGWMPIEEAPKDRDIIVYCPPAHGLDHMASVCAYHEDAGFSVCELRHPTHFHELPKPLTK